MEKKNEKKLNKYIKEIQEYTIHYLEHLAFYRPTMGKNLLPKTLKTHCMDDLVTPNHRGAWKEQMADVWVNELKFIQFLKNIALNRVIKHSPYKVTFHLRVLIVYLPVIFKTMIIFLLNWPFSSSQIDNENGLNTSIEIHQNRMDNFDKNKKKRFTNTYLGVCSITNRNFCLCRSTILVNLKDRLAKLGHVCILGTILEINPIR